MTKEEKQLLLVDLCARLPYGVIVDYKENEFELPHWKITAIYPETLDGWIGYDKRIGAGSESGSRPFNIGEVKPYLRSMSSITDEELKELNYKYGSIAYFFIQKPPYYYGLQVQHSDIGSIEVSEFSEIYVWLNAHHFDYRGLIEKGLAIEAPNNMYKTE